MGKKQDVLTAIFEECAERGDFVFDNEFVKQKCGEYGFGNPFDVTKLDNSANFPPIMLERDYFIVHLGRGKHQFVPGISQGFHHFEDIPESNVYNWKYRPSILNEYDTSESNVLSVASNQRIIHDFLYDDIVASPKVYHSRRTKASFDYRVGDVSIVVTGLQMEIDLTMEYQGVVTVFEAKNNFSADFAVYQLFHPFRYFVEIRERDGLPIETINTCYVLRKRVENRSVLRLYNYTFEDAYTPFSIQLLKCAQYNLVQR